MNETVEHLALRYAESIVRYYEASRQYRNTVSGDVGAGTAYRVKQAYDEMHEMHDRLTAKARAQVEPL